MARGSSPSRSRSASRARRGASTSVRSASISFARRRGPNQGLDVRVNGGSSAFFGIPRRGPDPASLTQLIVLDECFYGVFGVVVRLNCLAVARLKFSGDRRECLDTGGGVFDDLLGDDLG